MQTVSEEVIKGALDFDEDVFVLFLLFSYWDKRNNPDDFLLSLISFLIINLLKLMLYLGKLLFKRSPYTLIRA